MGEGTRELETQRGAVASLTLAGRTAGRGRREGRRIDRHAGALRDVWGALWVSRLAIWLAGIYGILAVGYRPTGRAPLAGSRMGDVGQLLLGTAAHWDGAFYVSIALHSYRSAPEQAFFPLYPIALAGARLILGSMLIGAVAVSLAAVAVALYLLHRLTTLELGSVHAHTAVLVLAFFPTSLFFSMAYAESLLLALTLGAVYAARRGRWALAGILGMLASATHNSGVLVGIPVVLLYLYGPRCDREGLPATIEGQRVPPRAHRSWRPAHRPSWDIAWLALIPVGLLAFSCYLGIRSGDPLRLLHLNGALWHRQFEPLGGVAQLPGMLWHSLRSAATAPPGKLFPATNGPYRGAAANLLDIGMFLFALAGAVLVTRRLPFAYSAFTMVALALFSSAPKPTEPLMSMPRLLLILFPLPMVLAQWLDRTPTRRASYVACSALALGVLSLQFATGRWVA